jgi:ABC-2 type transport system ATP-binding protein
MSQQNDDFDKRMAEMEQRMAEMMQKSLGQVVQKVDEVVQTRTEQLGGMVQNIRGAAVDFANTLSGMGGAPSAPPAQHYAPPAPARHAAPPPAPAQAPAPQQQPAAEAPTPPAANAPAAPASHKPLPSRKSTADGSKESQVFDRSNRPHLENPVLLKINDLSKRYDNGVLAVDQLNLDIHEGEIFCMLGANGAGKTSTLMLILSFSEPTGGNIEICGIDVHKDPLAAKKRMAYVSENVMLYGNFTALQNIEFFTRLAGKKATRDEMSTVLRRVGLSEEAHVRKVKSFSKGMRQRSGIAIAIMKDAEVILLDEPTSGLDPKGGMEFLRLLDQLRSEGRGILMTTHDIFRAKEIADRVGIMAAGNLVRVLEREEIEEADLAELYLQYIQEDVTHGKIA